VTLWWLLGRWSIEEPDDNPLQNDLGLVLKVLASLQFTVLKSYFRATRIAFNLFKCIILIPVSIIWNGIIFGGSSIAAAMCCELHSSALGSPLQSIYWISCFSIFRSQSLEFITCQHLWISLPTFRRNLETFYFQSAYPTSAAHLA